jgi:hypothetical protein
MHLYCGFQCELKGQFQMYPWPRPHGNDGIWVQFEQIMSGELVNAGLNFEQQFLLLDTPC